MGKYYILDKNNKVVEVGMLVWAEWFDKADRRVALDKTASAEVSTVFLGIDHRFGPGAPVLFETLVFGGPLSEEMQRYTTYEAAKAGHTDMVKKVIEAEANHYS